MSIYLPPFEDSSSIHEFCHFKKWHLLTFKSNQLISNKSLKCSNESASFFPIDFLIKLTRVLIKSIIEAVEHSNKDQKQEDL